VPLSSQSVMAQGSPPVYAMPSKAKTAAQTEIRMQEMEADLRQLTGKVESQIFEINSLKNKVRRLENDSQAAMADAVEPAPAPKARINQAIVAGNKASATSTAASQANPLGLDLCKILAR